MYKVLTEILLYLYNSVWNVNREEIVSIRIAIAMSNQRFRMCYKIQPQAMLLAR